MSVSIFDYTFSSEDDLSREGIQNDEKAFEVLFKAYYEKLVFFSNKFVNDLEVSQEIVSDVFTCLWEDRAGLNIKTSVNAYLYRTVQNRCLNHLKRKKIESEYVNYLAKNNKLSEIPELNRTPLHEKEMEEQIRKAIDELPEKCREVFKLSRFEHLKNKEIAENLNISPKTVERHMTIALDRLRQCLKHLFTFVLVYLSLS